MVCPTLVQVTNVSPQATKRQMKELFSYLGDIVDIRLFPEDDLRIDIPSKVCFVSFKETTSSETALHLTNTVFIDRALIVAQSRFDSMPDEISAMTLAAPAVALANRSTVVGHTAPLLPTPPSSILGNPPGLPASIANPVTNPISTTPAVSIPGLLPLPADMTDPHTTPQAQSQVQPLISLMGTVVPQPPPLTGNVDPTKIEEIRRTVYVGNLNSNLTAEQVLTFFQPCGEIKYVRMAGDETQPTRFAFVEFSAPESVPIALQYNGAMFGDRPIKVNHSKNAIVKPQGPTASEQKKEVEEAMRRVREAQMAILEAIDPNVPKVPPAKSKSRSRSRTPEKKKQRSRSRSKSREKEKRRSRSRSPRRRRSYSRSPPRRRRRSRSRSPVRRHRSPVHRRRSRSPARRYSRDYRKGRDYGRRSGRRSRSRSISPRRRDRERERDRDRDRHPRRSSRERSPEKPTRKSASPSPPRKSRSYRKKERERSPPLSRSPSPFEEYGPSEHSHNGKKSKKSRKEKKRKKRSPSPSPTSSPSNLIAKRSSSRSPGPVEDTGSGVSDQDMEVEAKSPPVREEGSPVAEQGGSPVARVATDSDSD